MYRNIYICTYDVTLIFPSLMFVNICLYIQVYCLFLYIYIEGFIKHSHFWGVVCSLNSHDHWRRKVKKRYNLKLTDHPGDSPYQLNNRVSEASTETPEI